MMVNEMKCFWGNEKMRKILFKGKRVDTGEWVEGFPFPSIPGEELNRMTVFEQYQGGTVVNTYKIVSSTLCQYIGLKDKNGTIVFESDKVYDPNKNKIFVVKWDNELASFVLIDEDGWINREITRMFYCKVIGNIHDNE